MAKRSEQAPTGPVLDRDALRELAGCFARAAVDELMATQEREPKDEPVADSDETERCHE
jgi:hypothetical protein